MMIDFDRFVRSVVTVRNDGGSRAYETGLRTFDCPLCGDQRGRGWLGVYRFAAGCFNPGCVAEPQLAGGALEWARRVLKLPDRSDARAALIAKYGVKRIATPPPAHRGEDFCVLPDGYTMFTRNDDRNIVQRVFEVFMQRQWGVTIEDAISWSLGWTVRGPYAFRVIIPIMMNAELVGFQARTIKDGVEPKYLTSSSVAQRGRPAECGRPAHAMLFNADAMLEDHDVLMVEGAGDVIGWHREHTVPPCVGLLGVALTQEKLSIISAARPRRVIVALDAQPDAQRRARVHVDALDAWGIDAVLGQWVGAKDAGAGASLVVE
jgi:hypothetical protein